VAGVVAVASADGASEASRVADCGAAEADVPALLAAAPAFESIADGDPGRVEVVAFEVVAFEVAAFDVVAGRVVEDVRVDVAVGFDVVGFVVAVGLVVVAVGLSAWSWPSALS